MSITTWWVYSDLQSSTLLFRIHQLNFNLLEVSSQCVVIATSKCVIRTNECTTFISDMKQMLPYSENEQLQMRAQHKQLVSKWTAPSARTFPFWPFFHTGLFLAPPIPHWTILPLCLLVPIGSDEVWGENDDSESLLVPKKHHFPAKGKYDFNTTDLT